MNNNSFRRLDDTEVKSKAASLGQLPGINRRRIHEGGSCCPPSPCEPSPSAASSAVGRPVCSAGAPVCSALDGVGPPAKEVEAG